MDYRKAPRVAFVLFWFIFLSLHGSIVFGAQTKRFTCVLYQKGGGGYFLVRMFTPYKMGISCRNKKKKIFIYKCPENKDVWYSSPDPKLNFSEGCGETKPRKWNEIWVSTSSLNKESEEGGSEVNVPDQVIIEFNCSL